MTRAAVSVFAVPYRPRKSTAASSRAFGVAAAFCIGLLGAIVILTVVYFVGAIV